ncbi:MAG: hypothetical protein M0R68_15725 [Bacteroidetes bacterium]|nr:hypothetical protein [Bacteroidota bacterium]
MLKRNPKYLYGYETSDGVFFKNEDAAKLHQAEIELNEACSCRGSQHRASQTLEWLRTINSTEVLEALIELAKQHDKRIRSEQYERDMEEQRLQAAADISEEDKI